MKQIIRVGGVYKRGETIYWKRKGGAFSPIDLFANNEQGAWYDPSDFSTMFQDSAGTTPVTAVGQTVGKILDKSGRGNHATQATEANRPVLQQDGNGKYYLGFDGVDDSLSTAGISWPGEYSAFAGVQTHVVSSGIQSIADSDPGTGTRLPQFLRINAAVPESIMFSGGSVYTDTGPSISADTSYVMSANGSASSLDLRVNAVSNGATTVIIAPNSSQEGLFIGINPSGSQKLNGRIYSLIVRGALSTTQEITDTETWVNEKTGAY